MDKITTGFCIYCKTDNYYCDEYGDQCNSDEFPYIHSTPDTAKNTLESQDYPQDFEIHEVEVIFNVLKKFERKISYEESDKDKE